MRGLTIGVFCLALLAREAEAQTFYEPNARQGYYIGGGFRGGVLVAEAEGDAGPGLTTGGGGIFRLGQMATEVLGFGLAFTGGGGANEEWSTGYGGLLLDVQVVPISGENLSLHAGIGMGGISVSRVDESKVREDDPGGAFGALYALGASYDWFPFYREGEESGGLAITAFLEAQLLPGGEVLAGGVFMGLEVTYWLGLSDNKLNNRL